MLCVHMNVLYEFSAIWIQDLPQTMKTFALHLFLYQRNWNISSTNNKKKELKNKLHYSLKSSFIQENNHVISILIDHT